MRIRITTAATVAALSIALVGCNSGDETPKTEPKTAAPAPATSSAFLRPTADQEKTLINDLKAIDPGLTVNTERAIRRSVDVCSDIRSGKDEATVIKNAAYRYDGGNASVDNAKAEKIVKAIKDSYCKS